MGASGQPAVVIGTNVQVLGRKGRVVNNLGEGGDFHIQVGIDQSEAGDFVGARRRDGLKLDGGQKEEGDLAGHSSIAFCFLGETWLPIFFFVSRRWRLIQVVDGEGRCD